LDNSISLNKYISDTGYCSRRVADQLIEAGRVLLNDELAQLGNRYTPGDVVEVDGSIISQSKKEKLIYIALNKPMGITSTTETHIPGNIISFVNHPKRIFPIGRLDKDSEGLIFLTNDGDIVNKILRLGNKHEKEYLVRVNKPTTAAFLQNMASGVPILGTKTAPCKIQAVGRQGFKLILNQGLNRQIRRMCEYLGYSVMTLQRTRIMNIKLDKLPVGKWRNLNEVEVAQLKASVETSKKTVQTYAPKSAAIVDVTKAKNVVKDESPTRAAKASKEKVVRQYVKANVAEAKEVVSMAKKNKLERAAPEPIKPNSYKAFRNNKKKGK